MGHLVVGNIHGKAVDVVIGEIGCLAANWGRAIACDGNWQRGTIDSAVIELPLQALQRQEHSAEFKQVHLYDNLLVRPNMVNA